MREIGQPGSTPRGPRPLGLVVANPCNQICPHLLPVGLLAAVGGSNIVCARCLGVSDEPKLVEVFVALASVPTGSPITQLRKVCRLWGSSWSPPTTPTRVKRTREALIVNSFEDDSATVCVLLNEEQYSLWPALTDAPDGWRVVFGGDTCTNILRYVEQNWADLRPKSLRKRITNR